jgi:regulatory protein
MSRSGNDGGEDRLAPVIPLFGQKATRVPETPDLAAGAGDDGRAASSHQNVPEPGSKKVPEPEPDLAQIADRAEEALVRKLRARSLSVSEARQVLRDHAADSVSVDDIIDKFCDLGYLDDALLAEHLVISGVERKGQGRVALSRALAQRGIPRDVIDEALGDLPDDDAERALEFARKKASSFGRIDFDTALRRLVGQLARRGYGGSVAMNAARTALTEAQLGGSTGGVRFVDSD